MKRVFIIVLDSCGIGAMPDAESFGDAGCNTIKSISTSPFFSCRNLSAMGLGNIDGVECIPSAAALTAAYGRLAEKSMGKDTTVGHWELTGVISENALPTYPDGFPEEIIKELEKATGHGFICNKTYSGTEVIRDFGDEHIKTGDLIIYTSADSVCQIAAHEDIVPVDKLYEYCLEARRIFSGKHSVGRIIARPFTGTSGNFARTANRKDFTLAPPEKTLLDAISGKGMEVISIGKISDIFSGRGITEAIFTHSNSEGIDATAKMTEKNFCGLCFTNLVDFDMLYGHRRDIPGYAAAFAEFDRRLPEIIKGFVDEDILIITADHGCDPGYCHTDHTREYVPLIIYGNNIKPVNLGTLSTFADVAATVSEYLDVGFSCEGKSFLDKITEK